MSIQVALTHRTRYSYDRLWLSVWCCGDLWLDLDPANGVLGSTDMVTLAWGRDYDDVSPMRGVLIGGGSQTLKVEVDVEPLPSSWN